MKAIVFLCLAEIICSVHGASKYNQRSDKQEVSKVVPIKNAILKILQNPQKSICAMRLLFNKVSGSTANSCRL